jgi:hypothetical protein
LKCGWRANALLSVTLNYLLTKDCAMAAKPICLTEYRKRKQEERRLKSVNERDIPRLDPFGFFDPLSLYPFEHSMIVDVTEPTDSDGE